MFLTVMILKDHFGSLIRSMITEELPMEITVY